ncbi:Fic family protein [Streptomyces sp. NPDC002309]
MRESADRRVPLVSRAARAYLDVAFFHPFPDGNARLAMLTSPMSWSWREFGWIRPAPCRPRVTRTTPPARQTWLPWSPASSARPITGRPEPVTESATSHQVPLIGLARS